jgi:nucleoid-associated protein YgaU
LLSTATTYCVQAGETLSIIAGKVYKNPRKWTVIFNANSNSLSSPGQLKEGQILTIPSQQPIN